MISTAIQTLLALIEALLPTIGVASTSVIEKIVAALVQIVPIIAANASNFLTPVKNIIAALSATPATNAAQLGQLQVLDAQVDAAFEAAAASTDAGT